jgi:hypothetical protein
LENASGRSGTRDFDEKLGAATLKSAITIKLSGQRETVAARQNMPQPGQLEDVVSALRADGGLLQGIEPQARRHNDLSERGLSSIRSGWTVWICCELGQLALRSPGTRFFGARLSPAAAGGNDKALESSGIRLEFRELRVWTPALRA